MPTYDYECTDCGHRFEMFQGMLEKKLTTCPSCGGALKRLIGAGAGIVFKGEGFHQTDYRSGDYRKRAKAETTSKEATTSTGKETGQTGAGNGSSDSSTVTNAAPASSTTPAASKD